MKQLVGLLSSVIALIAVAAAQSDISVIAKDGLIVHGTYYRGGHDTGTPLIHLFHQGGSNGRAEYGPLVPWLNEAGYRLIAWDLRSGGGSYYGGENRTKAGLGERPGGFCDAYPDTEAALLETRDLAGDAPVAVWGSSFSGALVFQLAAKQSDHLDAVLAFSPASGGPLADCRAALFLDGLEDPALVMRPASEMESDSATAQREIFEAAGITFSVVENGVHGSSMLVDDRTGHDMAETRAMVLDWLEQHLEAQ